MAHFKAFIHILSTNNIYNGHIYVRKCHLEPRKKLIFLPQNQPCPAARDHSILVYVTHRHTETGDLYID